MLMVLIIWRKNREQSNKKSFLSRHIQTVLQPCLILLNADLSRLGDWTLVLKRLTEQPKSATLN